MAIEPNLEQLTMTSVVADVAAIFPYVLVAGGALLGLALGFYIVEYLINAWS